MSQRCSRPLPCVSVLGSSPCRALVTWKRSLGGRVRRCDREQQRPVHKTWGFWVHVKFQEGARKVCSLPSVWSALSRRGNIPGALQGPCQGQGCCYGKPVCACICKELQRDAVFFAEISLYLNTTEEGKSNPTLLGIVLQVVPACLLLVFNAC